MFNSVALDVVISLVFIYLLYSLLITILGEVVSDWIGLRARVLRKAVEKMLNDGIDEKSSNWLDKMGQMLSQFFLQEGRHFAGSFADRFYDQPSIKYLTQSHKKSSISFKHTKPSYFSGKNFADTVAQMLRNKGNGTSEIDKIKFSLQYNTLHIEQETRKQFNNILHDAASDVEQFKKILEEWFDETMDRVNGWYKKKLQFILFWLGFIVVASFNVDTIKIVSLLSHDKEVLKETVEMAIASSGENSNISKYMANDHDSVLLKKAMHQLDTVQKNASRILGLGWEGIQPERIKLPIIPFYIVIYNQFNPAKPEFWGLVITALALSLGAHFWFDLLKKLISLRNAGVRPEDKKTPPADDNILDQAPHIAAVAASVLPQAPEAEELLEIFTNKLKNIPGIRGIGLEPLNNQLDGLIVVHVANPELKAILRNIHGDIQQLPGGFSLPVKYFTQGAGVVHAAEFGSEISNSTLSNGYGTLGAFMKKAGSDRTYLLSCWHVLKDNNHWERAVVSRDIIDINNNKIAKITEGCLADKIDIGIAECLETSFINQSGIEIKTQGRAVTAYDALMNTEVIVYGKACKLQEARVFHHRINTSLQYSDHDRMMYDLFSISIIDKENKIYRAPTSPGDSGAVVVDKNTKSPLGMIIGGNSEFSYAIKFSNTFSNSSLYKNYTFII